MWSHYLKASPTSWFWSPLVPSESTWSRSLKDKSHFTILPSSCSISQLVSWSFEIEWLLPIINAVGKYGVYFGKGHSKLPQDIDHSAIQPHCLYNRLWVIPFPFWGLHDQSWTTFLFIAGTFPSLVFLIANHHTICIDFFWPSECMSNWECLSIYWCAIVSSFTVGRYNIMLAMGMSAIFFNRE